MNINNSNKNNCILSYESSCQIIGECQQKGGITRRVEEAAWH